MSKVGTMLNDVLSVSNEAISYQYNARLFEDITEAISFIRTSQDPNKYDNKNPGLVKLGDIIRRHTGLAAHMSIQDVAYINAWVIVPDINRNNTINSMGYAESGYFSEKDVRNILMKKNLIEASVDLEKGRVSGFFTEISVPITMTKGLLNAKGKDGFLLDSEEIAAIILHEIGHCMTFMESMSRTMRKNWILESRLKDFRRASRTEKIKILSQLKGEQLLPKDTDEYVLAEVKNDNDALQMILGSHVKMVMSDRDTAMHDQTSFESASDQFAVRMGAGRHLATGLVKLHNQNLGWQRFFYWVGIYIDICIWSNIVIGIALGLLSGAVVLLIVSVMALFTSVLSGFGDAMGVYDKNEDRIRRILEEQITALKKNNLPDAQRKQLIDNYDRIKKSMEEINKYDKSLNTWIVTTIVPWLSRNKKSKEYQQLIESLQNNELYVAAHRF